MPQLTGNPLFDGIADAVLGTMAEPFTLIRANDEVTEAEGVYDARHFEVVIDGEAAVSEYQHTLLCRRAAVDPVTQGDTVELRGESFTVRDTRPDSEGMVVLALSRDDEP